MRATGLLPLCCVLIASGLHAQPAPDAGARVYGVEVEASATHDRVLVFGNGPLQPQVEQPDRGSTVLVFPRARLDPSAPRQVQPPAGGVVHRVSVSETAGDAPEVRIAIVKSPGAAPRLSQRGGQVALDFPRPGLPPAARPPAAGAPAARAAAAAAERTLPARWLNASVGDAITRLARFVGARLIFDDTLRGSISIEAPEPLTETEARAMIDALLLLKGYAAVKGPGDAYKIVPLAGAPGPWVETLGEDPDGSPLATLVRLHEIDAELVREAIAPLVGETAIAQVLSESNAILLAGPGHRLRRVADVMQALDETGIRRLVLMPLRYADAETAAALLVESVEDRGGRELEVWPDARTNRLLVRGAPDAVERARAVVARLDRPAEGRGRIQVIPVRYMDPERLATALRELVEQAATPGAAGGGSLAGRPFAVSVHGPTHSLVVQTDADTMAIVNDLVAELDQPPARVDVEVTVVELAHMGRLELSVDGLLPLVEPSDPNDLAVAVAADPSGNLRNVLLGNPIAASLFGRIGRAPIVLNAGDPATAIVVPRETGAITLDDREVFSRLLMRPRLSLLSGEEHHIFVGDNVPVPTADTAGSTNPLRTSQTIERRDVGIDLRVEPTVPADGPLVLKLRVEVSAIGPAIDAGSTFLERTLEATVRLAPDQEAVIGWVGLPRTAVSVVGTPFLMRVPILGALFRRSVDVEMSTYTMILVRASRNRPDADLLLDWMRREMAVRRGEVAAGAPASP